MKPNSRIRTSELTPQLMNTAITLAVCKDRGKPDKTIKIIALLSLPGCQGLLSREAERAVLCTVEN